MESELIGVLSSRNGSGEPNVTPEFWESTRLHFAECFVLHISSAVARLHCQGMMNIRTSPRFSSVKLSSEPAKMPVSSITVAPTLVVGQHKRVWPLCILAVMLAMPAVAVFFEFLPPALAPLRHVAAMLLASAVVAFVIVIHRLKKSDSIETTIFTSARPCVLFVADKPSTLSLLRVAFQQEFHVLTAQSAPEALRICAVHTVDVVVSHQRLCSMNGLELLCKTQRRHPAIARILLISFSDLASVVDAAREADLFACIDLPWKREALLEKMTEGAARAARQTSAQT